MRVLHLIRCADDHLALETAGQGGHDATIVLIQDGVRAVLPSAGGGSEVYVSAEDLQARGLQSDYELLSTSQVSHKILEHDRTIVW